MASQVDLAWEILRITALTLPALAILAQVILSMGGDENDSIPHRYTISTITLLLIAPLSLTAIIVIGVILTSYQIRWLTWALLSMGVTFFFLPIFLFLRWRERRRILENVYLEQKEKVIMQQAKREEISSDELERALNQIKSSKYGILWHIKNVEDSPVMQRLSKLLAVIIVLSGIAILYNSNELLMQGASILFIIYGLYSLTDWSLIDSLLARYEE